MTTKLCWGIQKQTCGQAIRQTSLTYLTELGLSFCSQTSVSIDKLREGLNQLRERKADVQNNCRHQQSCKVEDEQAAVLVQACFELQWPSPPIQNFSSEHQDLALGGAHTNFSVVSHLVNNPCVCDTQGIPLNGFLWKLKFSKFSGSFSEVATALLTLIS